MSGQVNLRSTIQFIDVATLHIRDAENGNVELPSSEETLLATAWIHVHASNGRNRLVRATVHQDAQSLFISEELHKNMKLKQKHFGYRECQ